MLQAGAAWGAEVVPKPLLLPAGRPGRGASGRAAGSGTESRVRMRGCRPGGGIMGAWKG